MINKVNIRNNVAKLLATENITIEYGSYSTAMFDTSSRILSLPLWDDVSEDVYSMLVGHEVGHALYTPDISPSAASKKFNAAPSMINVVEDVRIERLIRLKFPGLFSIFKNAYTDMEKQDFFGIEKKGGVDKFELGDRLNIAWKTGEEVFFNQEEIDFYKEGLTIETFEQTGDLAHRICVAQLEEDKDDEEEEEKPEGEGDGEGGESEGEGEGEGEGAPEDQSEMNKDQQKNKGSGSSEPDDGTEAEGGDSGGEDGESEEGDSSSDDIDSGDQTEEQEGETTKNKAQQPKTLSAQDLRSIKSETQDEIDAQLADKVEKNKSGQEYRCDETAMVNNILPHAGLVKGYKGAKPSSAAIESRKASKPFVNMCVNEFNRRKSAAASKRTRECQTGDINQNKLARYLIDDNIFVCKEISNTEQNHGMVFFLDMSGSMNGKKAEASVVTLVNLVDFCTKAHISYKVYGFSTSSSYDSIDSRLKSNDSTTVKTRKQIIFEKSNTVYELGYSGMSKAKFEDSIALIQKANTGGYNNNFGGGGTPLLECLTMANSITEKFKADKKLEKVSVMFLTDGSGCSFGRGRVEMDDGQFIDSNNNYDTVSMQLCERITRNTGADVMNVFIHNSYDAKGIDVKTNHRGFPLWIDCHTSVLAAKPSGITGTTVDSICESFTKGLASKNESRVFLDHIMKQIA